MYHTHWFNKQHFVAECCFICRTNLSISCHHYLQGVCCSNIFISGHPAATRYLGWSTSVSGWREGLRDVAQWGLLEFKVKVWIISTGRHEVALSKRNFSLLYMPNTISEAADFNEEGCLQQSTHVHFSNFLQPKLYSGRELSIMHTQRPQRRVVSPPISAW